MDREKRTDDTKAGLQLQRPMPNLSHSTAAEEAKTADPPRPAPDLPLGVPVPPIPQASICTSILKVLLSQCRQNSSGEIFHGPTWRRIS